MLAKIYIKHLIIIICLPSENSELSGGEEDDSKKSVDIFLCIFYLKIEVCSL